MITPAAWRASGQTFEWNGYSIFYRTHGHGDRALVLIHGFPTASWDWAPLWETLCARFEHVIALDMLGFGFSDKPTRHPYSLLEQTDIHQALWTRLGVTHAHVVAHDYGVSVAQELLARDLEQSRIRLLSVALLNGGLFPETHRMTSMQKLLRSPFGPIAQWLMNEQRFGKSFSTVFGPHTKPTASELRDFWSLIRHNGGHRNMHRLIAYIDERRLQRARWVGALQRTRVPLRLINGPADPVSGAHMAARYREVIGDPDVVSLSDIGHYPQTEAPQQVLQALSDFHHRVRA